MSASLLAAALVGARDAETDAAPTEGSGAAKAKPIVDRSGHKRVGKASVYADDLAGKPMADGTAMQSRGDNAASKTLPLGTKAEVTNLKTGKKAVVTIRDRGPYVKGRIIDLSPATAQKIGIDKDSGVSEVTVAPLSLPPNADSKVKKIP